MVRTEMNIRNEVKEKNNIKKIIIQKWLKN